MKTNLKLFSISGREIAYIAIAFYSVVALAAMAVMFGLDLKVGLFFSFAGVMITAPIASKLASSQNERVKLIDDILQAQQTSPSWTHAYIQVSASINTKQYLSAFKLDAEKIAIPGEIVQEVRRYEAATAIEHAYG